MACGYDFEYGGRWLSDFGFVMCSFEESSIQTIDSGSKITFNKIKKSNGRKHHIIGSAYEECLQAKFSICKDPEKYGDYLEILDFEWRDMMRWLNRHEMQKFRIVDYDDFNGQACYFYASFNLSRIMRDNKTYGIELTMETDAPFGYGAEEIIKVEMPNTASQYDLCDISDETGYTTPSVEIILYESGDLYLQNITEQCETVVRNCKSGETIFIDGDILSIASSDPAHNLAKDFNFIYPRIGNSYESRSNIFTTSLPCSIKLKYTPIIKDTPF